MQRISRKKRTWKQHTLGWWATSRQRNNFRPSRFSLNCPIISTKSENVTKIDKNGLKALQNNPVLGSGRSRKSGRHRGSEIIFLQRVFRWTVLAFPQHMQKLQKLKNQQNSQICIGAKNEPPGRKHSTPLVKLQDAQWQGRKILDRHFSLAGGRARSQNKEKR